MPFCKNLTRLRNSMNLSQEELAEMLGITKCELSEWESGKASPDEDEIFKLSQIFDVTPDQLLKAPGPIDDIHNYKKQNIYIILLSVFLMLISAEGFILFIFVLSSSEYNFIPFIYYFAFCMIFVPFIIFLLVLKKYKKSN